LGARFFVEPKNWETSGNFVNRDKNGESANGFFDQKTKKNLRSREMFDFSAESATDASIYGLEAAKISAAQNPEDNHFRASFSTSFATSSWNRKQNIKTAAKRLNITLYPDEVFSFNAVVGERTIANGFLSAPIILDGKFVNGVGGGVCQVSSTLYNCALLADLEILNAKQHSMTVGYVSASFDAMVSSKNDLTFVNSTASPIKIKATTSDSSITISIYGDIPTRKLVRRSEIIKVIPSPIKEVEDASLPVGTAKILAAGKRGLVSRGYLDIYENGKLVVARLIRKDGYMAQPRIVAIGTKPVSDQSEPEVEG